MNFNPTTDPLDPGPLLDEQTFFVVIDAVLVEAGRSALAPNGPQRGIIKVRNDDQVLQILAGPGSGKTEMLVLRVLYDLFVRGTDPARLIVTTFTRRAASDLVVRTVERAEALQQKCAQLDIAVRDPQIHNLRIGTIHSLCEQILVEHDAEYRDAGRTMIDQAESFARMARNLYSLGRHKNGAVERLMDAAPLRALFTPPWDSNDQPLGGMKTVNALTDMIAQHVETWVPRCEASSVPNGVEAVHGPAGLTDDLTLVTERWEKLLEDGSVVDFATMQRLFLSRQHLFLDRYDHVFVDEFQDSNPIQFAIHTRWLSGTGTKLTVVADDDQSLYRFRGSDIDCLLGLRPFCEAAALTFRMEVLETNYRSTARIVRFAQEFRDRSVLAQVGLAKTIGPAPDAAEGNRVRLLTGPWDEVCAAASVDLDALGVGRPGADRTAAVLMFSTRESDTRRRGPSPALTMRRALEARGIRVHNLGSKTAADRDSPVIQLFGLLSYLVDPISCVKFPGGKRAVEVHATSPEPARAAAAASQPPGWQVLGHHAACQKWFIKHGNGRIGAPEPDRKVLTDYLDDVRAKLVAANGSARLTLAGLIARLLAQPFFRRSGFTPAMFRQALFTQLFEANVAPTRLTMQSLDKPLAPAVTAGKIVWEPALWSLLHAFGGYLRDVSVEDEDVEAFEQDAVLMMTHHRAKGLEFDHVVAGGLGRVPDHGPALRTRLFSGQAVPYEVTETSVVTDDPATMELAMADRERETYVAITRAKRTLTILQDSGDPHPMFLANPTITDVMSAAPAAPHPHAPLVEVRSAT